MWRLSWRVVCYECAKYYRALFEAINSHLCATHSDTIFFFNSCPIYERTYASFFRKKSAITRVVYTVFLVTKS